MGGCGWVGGWVCVCVWGVGDFMVCMCVFACSYQSLSHLELSTFIYLLAHTTHEHMK